MPGYPDKVFTLSNAGQDGHGAGKRSSKEGPFQLAHDSMPDSRL
jgi:hypothetical protein